MSLDTREWTSCAEVSAPRSHASRKRRANFPRELRGASAIAPASRRADLPVACVFTRREPIHAPPAPARALTSRRADSFTTRRPFRKERHAPHKLLGFTNLGAEWVLWLLIALSIASVGVMIERFAFFLSRRAGDVDALQRRLLAGDLSGAAAAVEGRRGMEAEVVRAAVAHAAKGPEAVREVVSATMERARIDYELRLAFLGTLGNNAPFIGLFGTVLGIIRAFHDLSQQPAAPPAPARSWPASARRSSPPPSGCSWRCPRSSPTTFQRSLRRTAQRAIGARACGGRAPRGAPRHGRRERWPGSPASGDDDDSSAASTSRRSSTSCSCCSSSSW